MRWSLAVLLLSVSGVPAQEPLRMLPQTTVRLPQALLEVSVPLTYTEAHDLAVRLRRPLIVYVAQPLVEVSGCVICAVPMFPYVTGPAVVVGLPDGQGCLDRADFAGPVAPARLRDFIQGWQETKTWAPALWRTRPGTPGGFAPVRFPGVSQAPRLSLRSGGGC